MGHVDHGKTTLMDAIRKTRVAGGAAAGILSISAPIALITMAEPLTHLSTDAGGHAPYGADAREAPNVTTNRCVRVAQRRWLMPRKKWRRLIHAKAAPRVKLMVWINKIDLPSAKTH